MAKVVRVKYLILLLLISGCGEGVSKMTCTDWVKNDETQCPLWIQECDVNGVKYDHFWRSCTSQEWWNKK